MKSLTEEWIKKAEEDYTVAKREWEANPVYNAVCFHAQQCVERYMKAVLQENDIAFQKIHDLEVLLEKCSSFIPELRKLQDDLRSLTVYAVEVRYPGFEALSEDAEKALLAMERTTKLLLERRRLWLVLTKRLLKSSLIF